MPWPHLWKLAAPLGEGIHLWKVGETGHKTPHQATEKTADSNCSQTKGQTSNPGNLAPEVSSLGLPHAGLRRVEEFSTISLWNPTSESTCSEDEGVTDTNVPWNVLDVRGMWKTTQ